MATVVYPPQTQTNTPPTGEKISFWDYVKAYNSVEGMRTEWAAGTVERHMTNNVKHQDILGFLFLLFRFFLDKKQLGKVVLAGVPMYVGDDKPAREPDLMIVLEAHKERLKATYLDGIADVVVEIVSPDSDERDRGKKYVEYEQIGVPEYWLIDPIRSEADVYVLGEDRHYHRAARDAQGPADLDGIGGICTRSGALVAGNTASSAATLALVEQMQQ